MQHCFLYALRLLRPSRPPEPGESVTARIFYAAAACLAGLLAPNAHAATPIGGASISGNTISGWACDPAMPSAAILVDFYADGVGAVDGTGATLPSWARYKGNNTYADNYAGGAYANLASSAQSPSCNGGNHGFSFTIPQSFRSAIGPGVHDIYLFMRNTNGAGPNPQMYATPFKLTVTGTQTVVDPWHNNFLHSCSSWKGKTWPQNGALSYVFTPGVLCQDDYPGGLNPISDPFWALESTNETIGFGPFYDGPSSSIDFPPQVTTPGYAAPMWNYGLYPRAAGGYTVGWVIDKINGLSARTKLDTHTGAFIETELGANAPDLSASNVFVELWFRVRANEQANLTAGDAPNLSVPFASIPADHRLARNRLTFGMWLAAPGSQTTVRNIEINLARTANFDLCTTGTDVEGADEACEKAGRFGPFYADDVGLFDRRSVRVPIVYYNIGTIHQVAGLRQPSANDGTFSRVLIPVNALLRNAPWLGGAAFPLVNGTADIGGQRLRSFYIGTEVWGKGRIWVEFERLNIFKFVAN